MAALDFVDADTLELVSLYIQLINELINYDVDLMGQPITLQNLQQQYESWFISSSYAFQEEERAIVLDTNSMTGDIYHYIKPTYQYKFIEIDVDTFVRINSIWFYHNNFENNPKLASKGADIRVEDVSITCIKYLDNINGDYRLDLEYQDIYFGKNSNDKDTLDITAKLLYKTQDITNYSQIM